MESEMVNEYTHVVVDKAGVGLDALRQAIADNGLQTAQQLGIQLAAGSVKLEHHLHIFLWDSSVAGVKGRRGIESAGSCFVVRVRWPALTESGYIFSGTLKGDGGHNGPPAGKSPNGAWAYQGEIPRRYCFIEGFDSPETPTFANWREGLGW
jgi:hypothetical protein